MNRSTRGYWLYVFTFQAGALPKQPEQERTITGHIDFVQVRNGAIHLLDYKPNAKTNKPFAQFTIYALALSHLTGIPLFDFKCAWFNEKQYCEFFPRTILARQSKSDHPVPLTLDSTDVAITRRQGKIRIRAFS